MKLIYEKYCFVRLVIEFEVNFWKMFIFCLCVYDFDDIFLEELGDFLEVLKIIMVDCLLK